MTTKEEIQAWVIREVRKNQAKVRKGQMTIDELERARQIILAEATKRSARI